MKKQLISILWLVSFVITALNAENEIPNGSFEAGQLCKPDGQSQVDNNGSGNGCTTCLYEWENFNTSDWYTQVVGFPCLSNGALFNGTYDVSGQTAGHYEIIGGLPVLNAHQTGFFYAGFGPQYNLMPFDSLSLYLKNNKHLPGIPTAKEMESNNGVALGELNSIYLRKIEELTLYVIQLNNRITELEKTKK